MSKYCAEFTEESAFSPFQRTCVATGLDGIFMEVHDDPNSSPVDGPTQWPLRNFRELLTELLEIGKVSV